MISAMDILYLLGLLATAAFAASGILAAMGTRIDLFGAVVVAIVTALGGGLLRDTLTGRETLLVSPELYATPIIIGLLLQALTTQLVGLPPDLGYALGAATIVLIRMLATHCRWRMPEALIKANSDDSVAATIDKLARRVRRICDYFLMTDNTKPRASRAAVQAG
ncbi:MAG: hypothetical protein C1943_04460 [Halochromatium sp.]|nr:hypothetical protein [Halochromatium sp.]